MAKAKSNRPMNTDSMPLTPPIEVPSGAMDAGTVGVSTMPTEAAGEMPGSPMITGIVADEGEMPYGEMPRGEMDSMEQAGTSQNPMLSEMIRTAAAGGDMPHGGMGVRSGPESASNGPGEMPAGAMTGSTTSDMGMPSIVGAGSQSGAIQVVGSWRLILSGVSIQSGE